LLLLLLLLLLLEVAGTKETRRSLVKKQILEFSFILSRWQRTKNFSLLFGSNWGSSVANELLIPFYHEDTKRSM